MSQGMVVNKKIHNFGTIEQRGTVSDVFYVTNKSSETVKIVKIRSTVVKRH